MPFKLTLLVCLSAFLNLANAQEEMLPIDLIELLGEFNEDETLILKEVISEIETPNSEDNKQMKDVGAAYEDSAQ
ncbi:MAG: hypothetical protein ACKE5M_07695 [Methylophilaceae bacterium]